MGWTTQVRFLAWTGIFSLHHYIWTSHGVHSASYPIGIGVLSLGGKVTKA